MKTCCYCQRPLKEFYGNPAGDIYCYDCWIRMREQAQRETREKRNVWEQSMRESQILNSKISDIESKISSHRNLREELQSESYVRGLNEQIRELRTQLKYVEDKRRIIHRIDPRVARTVSARYFTSEEEYAKFMNEVEQQRKEEELKREEEQKRIEEEQKRIEAEQKRRAEELEKQKEIVAQRMAQELRSLEETILCKEKLTNTDYIKVARNTRNKTVIAILKSKNNIEILDALLANKNVATEEYKSIIENKNRIKRKNRTDVQASSSGCLGSLLIIIGISSLFISGIVIFSNMF